MTNGDTSDTSDAVLDSHEVLKRDVWRVADLITSPHASLLDDDILRRGKAFLDDHAIELYERPSDRPGVAGHPGAHPAVLKFCKMFFRGAHRVYALDGANQSGKTVCVGGLSFCRFVRDNARNGDVFWVVAQSHEAMRDIPHKTLWQFLPRSMFPPGLVYAARLGFGQISTLTLTLPDERGTCELWFKTEEMDSNAFESARLRGVWWSECRREELYELLIPRILRFNGFLLMDYIPCMGWHRFRIREAAESGESPHIFHARLSMMDNAHNLPPGAIDFALREMSEESAALRIHGRDAADFGVVFRSFDRARHVIAPFDVPVEWPRWRTMDYGYRNPTAVLWAAAAPPGFVLPDGRTLDAGALVVYRELYVNERSVEDNARDIINLSDGEHYMNPMIIDPTAYNITQANGASIASVYRDFGLVLRPGRRVNEVGGHAIIELVRSWFSSDRLFFFSTCVKCIYEHCVFRYRDRKDGTTPSNEPFLKKNDHTVDALKLLIVENPVWRPADTYEISEINDLL